MLFIDLQLKILCNFADSWPILWYACGSFVCALNSRYIFSKYICMVNISEYSRCVYIIFESKKACNDFAWQCFTWDYSIKMYRSRSRTVIHYCLFTCVVLKTTKINLPLTFWGPEHLTSVPLWFSTRWYLSEYLNMYYFPPKQSQWFDLFKIVTVQESRCNN